MDINFDQSSAAIKPPYRQNGLMRKYGVIEPNFRHADILVGATDRV